jgi:hypothetical protein
MPACILTASRMPRTSGRWVRLFELWGSGKGFFRKAARSYGQRSACPSRSSCRNFFRRLRGLRATLSQRGFAVPMPVFYRSERGKRRGQCAWGLDRMNTIFAMRLWPSSAPLSLFQFPRCAQGCVLHGLAEAETRFPFRNVDWRRTVGVERAGRWGAGATRRGTRPRSRRRFPASR